MPNQTYSVRSGDRLTYIAARFYGDGNKASYIVDSNPQLANRDKSAEGYPIIYVGDILNIPALINKPKDPSKLDSKDPTEIKIMIGGKPFSVWETASIKRSFDVVADSFTIGGPWNPNEFVDRETFRPFTYPDFSLYIGGEKIMSGIIVNHDPETSADKNKITISGYSRPGILADVPLPLSMYPFEANGLNLKQIIEKCCAPYGIQVEYNADTGPAFTDNDKIDIEPGQIIYDYLIGLVRQRGVVLSSDVQGNLLVQTANIGDPVETIIAGQPPFVKSGVNYNGQARHSSYTAIGTEAIRGEGKSATIEDNILKALGIQRPLIFDAKDTNSGSLKEAATAQYGRSLAESSSFNVTVQGWRRPSDNQLRKDNETIIYQNAGDMIYQPTLFLIRDVEYTRSPDGELTELNIVFPECYNGQIRSSYPWDE